MKSSVQSESNPRVITSQWRKFVASGGRRKIWMVKEFLLLAAYKFMTVFVQLGLMILSRGRPVQIGTLNKKGKISIMVGYIELRLRHLQVESARRPFFIVIDPGVSPNEQLSKMYSRVFWLLDERSPLLRNLFSTIYRILWRSGSSMAVSMALGENSTMGHAWQNGKPSLSFTKQELVSGTEVADTLKVPRDAHYVCLNIREDAYYQQVMKELVTTGRNQDKELEKDLQEADSVRNPDLKNYIPMATECAEQDIYILRMGQVVAEPLPPGLHPKIIDYARINRTPFGDIYLLANCKFVVSGTAGLCWVASAFDRPTVITDNYHLWGRPPRKGDLFIPTTYYLVNEKRFLTFKEMMSAQAEYSYRSNCDRDGIELIHNTPEEIAAVVQEMNQRLDGTWESSNEDEDLQQRFDSLYEQKRWGYGLPSRIGAKFLRQHSDLL